MRGFCESDPDAMTNALLAERARYLKRAPKGVVQICEVFDEIRQEGIEQGIEQGEERVLIASLRSEMERLFITAQGPSTRSMSPKQSAPSAELCCDVSFDCVMRPGNRKLRLPGRISHNHRDSVR